MPKLLVNQAAQRVMGLPNVLGVGLGPKTRGGVVVSQRAFVVFVSRKQPFVALSEEELIPASFREMPTDVVEIGEVNALGATDESAVAPTPRPPEQEIDEKEVGVRLKKHRPLQPGTSIGHYKVSAGTLGAVVYDFLTNEPLLLSNNHVLANCCGPTSPSARIGDSIMQPGPLDGGKMDSLAAHLHRYVPLRSFSSLVEPTWWPGPPPIREQNLADAAVARPYKTEVSREIVGIGTVKGPALEMPGIDCMKSGRTTGVTTGYVRAVGCVINVGYPGNRIATFREQFVCTCESRGGDSGSLILNTNREAIGLLFAGSDKATLATPIHTVLNLLNVRF